MRVLDIIVENTNPLDILNTSAGAASSINRFNAQPNQVSYIKQQLARHKLVTGYNQTTGARTLGGMAWTGSIDQNWTAQLDQAITAWKRSINIQLSNNERGPLDVNPTAPGITRQDVQYLVNTELGSDGLLDSATGGGLTQRTSSPGRFSGLTYSETIPGTREQVAADGSTQSLYDAVGWSAWYRISVEIEEFMNSSNGESWLENTDPRDIAIAADNRLQRTFGRNRTTMPQGQWLTNIMNGAGRSVATYADGTTQPINATAPGSGLSPSPSAVELFDYYSNMAIKLWEKDNRNRAQTRQTAADVSARPVSAVTLDDANLRTMASQLEAAFQNDLVAAFPGGRSFWNDLEAIQTVLARLRTASDFDNLSRVYSEVTNGKVLHEQLYEELDKNDYMQIVVVKLLSIRRIAPRILFTSINFGDNTEVEVEYNDRTYSIQQQPGPTGEPVIEGYTGENNYDAIVIDAILRAGIEASGGTAPNFDEPPNADSVTESQILFINTIQNTYPEMVPFYVRAEPFDSASVDIGGARLREIIDDSARMGGNEILMTNFITQEILNDRTWLLGDEDTEPAANIRFDDRWQTEGLQNRDFPVVSADEDVELNANEEEIFENLKSTQASVVREAVDTLLQSDDPAEMWENIYRKAASQGLYLDEAANMGNGQDDVEEFLSGRDPGTNIIRIARTNEIGLAMAAPRVCAKMFYNAGKGRYGTTEETIDALIAQIRDRYDYELIDERYRQLPNVDDSLIDDLAGEQFQGIWGGGWYGALAAKIGDNRRLDLIRTELDRSIMDALEDVERIPNADNIDRLKRVTTNSRQFMRNEEQLAIVVERLQEIVSDIDRESPEALVLMELLSDLQTALENI